MSLETDRKISDLPSGDPGLLNRLAWARRWTDPASSIDYALAARRKALAGRGRRSRAEQGFALRTLGWQALWRGDLSLSMDYCLRAETYLPESSHIRERAGIYSLLGKVHYMRNRFDLAICSVERGLWLMRDVEDDTSPLADLLLTQASIQRLSGERARAGITLGRARELSEGENRILVAICSANLLLDDNDETRALEHARSALADAEDMDTAVLMPFARSICAACLLAHGSHLDAQEQVSLGLASLDQTDDPSALAKVVLLQRRAGVLASNGDLAGSIDVLKGVAEIAQSEKYWLILKSVSLALADAFEKLGDFEAAVEQHKVAWQLQSETRVR